ncbi:hypothetical protein [Paraburkholderia rhizosphaerae]|nr:hypothetical protein [Paraburkholderia rhizosphaerae]
MTRSPSPHNSERPSQRRHATHPTHVSFDEAFGIEDTDPPADHKTGKGAPDPDYPPQLELPAYPGGAHGLDSEKGKLPPHDPIHDSPPPYPPPPYSPPSHSQQGSIEELHDLQRRMHLLEQFRSVMLNMFAGVLQFWKELAQKYYELSRH